MERILIVARMREPAEAEIARLFGHSDGTTPLPELGGAVSRSLFSFQGLYFQLMEVEGSAAETMARIRDRPEFQELSRNLTQYIEPYDPQSWRSPRDAMATEFYRWER
ncbi:TcmI family type II polyketide cyclase [Spongiactinospora gelatinilytica]|uniref:TcmI family type II polyketide cyclase n=1 Tax=Spongiactinospora gelatinilytica TaxID=2666298 RepID=A0A2W2ERZ0_9ACTN|nr:TcmI family type II polyketide cyclase [Spongiactinospora gelatinilytica]PZG25223.1 TcmI family type II polyketide cyclase [Spongiactinospora gelatinilytica]